MTQRNPLRRLRFLRPGARLLLALVTAHAPLHAFAEEAAAVEWDQERVTELAVQLAVATRDLRNAVRTGISSQRGRAQAHSRNRLLDNLRVLQNETRHLAGELESGQGYAETLPIAQRIDRLVARARPDARRLLIPQPVQQRLDRARELLEELRPFYRGYETPEEPEA